MDFYNIIGFTAAILTTIAFLPQVIKTWQTKSAKDISLGMYLIFCAGVSLWFVYGFLTQDYPIMLANGLTLLLALVILFFKFRFKE